MNKCKSAKPTNSATLPKLSVKFVSKGSDGKHVTSDDEQEPTVGNITETKRSKRSFSDDDSPLEPGQQATVESVISGEMSKILDNFGNDVAKSLHTKRRRLQQYLRTCTKDITNRVLGLGESLVMERRKVVEEFEKRIIASNEQIESDMKKAKESEDRIMKTLVQYQKQHQQSVDCVSNKLKALKSLWASYFDAMKKMETKEVDLQTKLGSDIKDEIMGLQEKILVDAQEHEIVKMRSNLQSILM